MNDIEILENYICIWKEFEQKHTDAFISVKEIPVEVIENIIARNKELEEKNKKLEEKAKNTMGLIGANYIHKDKVKEKIEELDRRIDYLDKELNKAYIERDKLGTETEIDTNEQYIYNMEQERSIRHTQKYAYKELLQ